MNYIWIKHLLLISYFYNINSYSPNYSFAYSFIGLAPQRLWIKHMCLLQTPYIVHTALSISSGIPHVQWSVTPVDKMFGGSEILKFKIMFVPLHWRGNKFVFSPYFLDAYSWWERIDCLIFKVLRGHLMLWVRLRKLRVAAKCSRVTIWDEKKNLVP